MRVLVCGGRNYRDRETVFLHLTKAKPTVVIQGGADGADLHARDWAFVNGVTCSTFAAEWGKHGRAAGPIRNQRMIDEGAPDVVIAFPGGRGTADMVRRAKAAGIRVITVAQSAEPAK